MSGMVGIYNEEMYRRALREITRLEALRKAGTINDLDRQRLRNGIEMSLAWEWEQEGLRIRLGPKEEIVADPIDPRALAFRDWYERVRHASPWRATDWKTAFLYWMREEAFEDCVLEDAERLMEGDGMVLTDLDGAA